MSADVTRGGSPLSLTLLVHPTNTVCGSTEKSALEGSQK